MVLHFASPVIVRYPDPAEFCYNYYSFGLRQSWSHKFLCEKTPLAAWI